MQTLSASYCAEDRKWIRDLYKGLSLERKKCLLVTKIKVKFILQFLSVTIQHNYKLSYCRLIGFKVRIQKFNFIDWSTLSGITFTP